MSQAPVGSRIHQPLDARGNFSSQVPFHPAGTVNRLSDLGDLGFRQLIGFGIQSDLGFP
jgi:hypothetical protein